jgi:hypothetical protein
VKTNSPVSFGVINSIISMGARTLIEIIESIAMKNSNRFIFPEQEINLRLHCNLNLKCYAP